MNKGRRSLTQQGMGLIGASALIPAIGHQASIADVERVLRFPSSGLGDKELKDLEQRMRYYWLDRQNATVAPNDLILMVRAYVQEVASLLRCSLLPSIRTRLCACLSQGMLLIGVCYYDVGQFQAARTYYQTAGDAAHEADHAILQALTWVWDSYSWMRSNETGRYERALKSVTKAYGFASLGSDLAVLCNVQEASAEVYAYLKEKAACLDALKSIATLAESGSGDWHYVHQFDLSKLYAVQGICLQQFYEPGIADTYPLLEDAKQALKEALSQPNVLAVRRAFHVVDLAQVHAREGEVEAACDYAKQVISLANTKAPLRQRLWTVRTHLEPYADVEAVKDLDREIRSLLLLG